MVWYSMSHHDQDEWEPKGAQHTFNGFSVWDHGVFATDLNHGDQEGKASESDHDH